MFTFRAEQHQSTSSHVPTYQVWQAASYAVSGADDGLQVELVGGKLPAGAASPEGSSLMLYVGDKNTYACVYIMNDAGKTIDTIR